MDDNKVSKKRFIAIFLSQFYSGGLFESFTCYFYISNMMPSPQNFLKNDQNILFLTTIFCWPIWKKKYFSKIFLRNNDKGYQLHTVAKFQANRLIIQRVNENWSEAICNCSMYNARGGSIFKKNNAFMVLCYCPRRAKMSGDVLAMKNTYCGDDRCLYWTCGPIWKHTRDVLTSSVEYSGKYRRNFAEFSAMHRGTFGE